MNKNSLIAALLWCGMLTPLLGVRLAPAQEEPFTEEAIRFFTKEVQPILQKHCYQCHGEKQSKSNFSLMKRQAILKGGDYGKGVDLEKPENSLLLNAIHWKDGLEMPPAGKMKPTEIETLTKWVKAGLPMVDGKVAEDHSKVQGGVVTDEARKYWAFQPVKEPAIPMVSKPDWVKNPIDAFILAKLDQKGIAPNQPAERLALVRRAYYDLIGLPPTPEQVEAFLADQSENSFEKLIDQLLDSHHYGEKWARHWLDVVRFAETNGYERDSDKPFAWRYRDYVIDSFNQDVPYNQFILEQLAGDELPNRTARSIVATGYYRLGIWDDEPADRLLARYDELDDWVATTSQAFLGLTMNCARCHEHKIDPFPHADYYKLVAFFQDIKRYDHNKDPRNAGTFADITPPGDEQTKAEAARKRQIEIVELEKKILPLAEKAIKKMSAADQRASEGAERPAIIRKVPMFLDPEDRRVYTTLRRRVAELEKAPTEGQQLALAVNNSNLNPPTTHVLLRGSPQAPADMVEPGFPAILANELPKIPKPVEGAKSSGRRLVLAKWIASKDNVLTARVFVNRLWQHHFGRGLVASTNDFGRFGTGCSHPELLDWLASDFMKGDWKIKRMHKLLMLSSTYQQSAVAQAAALKADPANELFGRFSMRRLTAEEVRDSILHVSGQLNLQAGGPSVYPKIPREVLAGQSVPGAGWHTSSKEQGNRRSVYVFVKRSLQVPILIQHDQADTDSSCPVRYVTTVPTQALGMLNGEFTREAAEQLANRIAASHKTVDEQIQMIIQLTTCRKPSKEEVQKDRNFIEHLQKAFSLNSEAALVQYCLLALNTNEFIYVD
ncbi:MAG: PSD1 and planctomycete cytochrome C domain-containing protein [Zavarzinella sp.]